MDHTDETTSEPGRYEHANGWRPPDPAKKLREAYRKKHPEQFCYDTLFETKTANECLAAGQPNQPPANLFGDLWRTGELAVLFAETGTGKSLLATQIAESIARGRGKIENGKWRIENRRQRSPEHSQFSTLNSQLGPQDVLYLDLAGSKARFAQRYSCPSPIPGKLPVKYRFSGKFRRTGFGDLEVPEVFNGDWARYMQHSLNLTFDREEPEVIIIDDLSYLDSQPAAAVRRMRSLKHYAAQTGTSILVITHAKTRRGDVLSSPPYQGGVAASRRRGGSLRLLELNGLDPHIAAIADTVFAIGRSTFGPDIRYVKHLRSSATAITHDESNVLVYKLGKMENATGSDNSLLPAINHQLRPQPFLGFEYLGVAAEQDLLRDYAAEQRAAEVQERSRIKKLQRSSRDILVDGVLDGSYLKYLKGE